MKMRFLMLALVLLFTAAPLTASFAIECEIIQISKKNVTMQCDQQAVQDEAIVVKKKVKMEKIN